MRVYCRSRTSALLSALVCILQPAFAAPPIGTAITNQASATFVDGGGATLPSASNVVTFNVGASAGSEAVLAIDKVALTATPQPGDLLAYRLTLRNIGSGAATTGPVLTIDGVPAPAIVIRDVVPPNTTFDGFTQPLPAGVAPVYHRIGDPEHTYSNTAPADPTTLDAVGVTVASIAPGASTDITFAVRIHMNAALNGSGALTNVARAQYDDNLPASIVTVQSPPAMTTLAPVAALIRNYTAPDYATVADYARLGSTLYLRADAAACNVDAAVVETRLAVITGPNGERETYTATETGTNTGLYTVTPVPTQDAPVTVGNGIVESAHASQVIAEIQGCGVTVVVDLVMLDPFGVLFDSRTNAPVAGATVTLVRGDGANGCTAIPATVRQIVNGVVQPALNPVVTDADGRYQFELVDPGDYCLTIAAPAVYSFPSLLPVGQLPAGRAIDGTGPGSGGSYGGNFRANATTGPVMIDVPLDALAPPALFVQKAASRQIVELADFVDYTLRIRNNGGSPAGDPGIRITDDLPAGFAYVAGSARMNGTAIADPAGSPGPQLVFDIAALAAGEQTEITYRLRVGPGALEGDGVNRARASFAAVQSNEASARVRVIGGVFSDRGYIVGRVFVDCNRNMLPDADEVGIPGVRVYLDDGTSAVSDSEGKYSFYGIAPRTHVLKLDATTMPPGSQLAALTLRNAGDAGSVFVDVKNGELAKANFAEGSCSLGVRVAVQDRRSRPEPLVAETERTLGQRMEADATPRVPGDVKAQPASGTVGAQAAATAGFTPAAPPKTVPLELASPQEMQPHESPGALETLLPTMSPRFGFSGLKDGDTLPLAHTHVRVKGRAGAEFRLSVNGKEVPASRVGKRSVLEERKVQAWEYVGVALKPGENELVARELDGFGNERAVVRIKVIAPDAPARLSITVPHAAVADGQTPARVLVQLTDARGVPVTARTPITLEASAGEWDVRDLDPREEGTQVFITGGKRELKLLPPEEPTDALVRATSGRMEAEARLDFLPNLRELIGAGTVEGVLNLRRLDSRALVPARRQDGFEQELTALSHTSGDGKRHAGARAALFLKGKVKGEYLLTLAFASDKDTRDRLFRDIQPDEFYPVYGDSSVRSFDAQSTAKLYVRVDRNRSWLLYGDFTTQSTGDSRRLGIYSRSLTGAKEHYERDRLAVDAFASYDSTRQIIEEIPANGTSGPYPLANPNLIENSEKVEILIRDRNQPAVVLESRPQARFFDYELEPLTGRLVFKSPLPSLDPDFNPRSIRVTYEVDSGGEEFWVGGIDTRVLVTERLQVDAIAVEDRNPQDRRQLQGVNATFEIAEGTYVVAEVARVDAQSTGDGDGRRLEVRHDSSNLQAHAYVADTDTTFDNPGAWLAGGRAEAGAKATWRVNDRTLVRGEALRTEDELNGGRRTGAFASVERTLAHDIRLELGVRHGEETAVPASASSPLADLPNEFTSVKARAASPVPGLADASVFAEYEQDFDESARRIAAVGGDYRIADRGRVYVRHELISALAGPYALNRSQEQNATVIGVDTDYLTASHLFSEYRIRDALSGAETEAAIGLRNQWKLAEGVGLTTGFERVHVLDGAGTSESLALTFGVDYTARPLWKGTARLELRDSESSRGGFATFGIARKLSREWSFLARNSLAMTRNSGSLTGERIQDRFQAGLAWRDTDTDRWSVLGRVEHRYEKDDTQGPVARRDVQVIALNANYQPVRPLVVTGRYAGKWVTDDRAGFSSSYDAHLFATRATYELSTRWDVGVQGSVLFSGDREATQHGLGLEIGRVLTTNLWLSVGYNVFGFSDDDLAGADYTNRGGFLRLRFKFDEKLLGGALE